MLSEREFSRKIRNVLIYVGSRMCPPPPTPKDLTLNFSSPPTQRPLGGDGRDGDWNCCIYRGHIMYIAVSAPFAVKTYFSSQTGE
jgi:hypothetical protein